MTPEDRTEARRTAEEALELAEQATEGPWRWGQWATEYGSREPEDMRERTTLERSTAAQADAYIRERDDDCELVLQLEDETEHTQDQRFMAASRTLVPQLARLVLEQQDEIDRLRAGAPVVVGHDVATGAMVHRDGTGTPVRITEGPDE